MITAAPFPAHNALVFQDAFAVTSLVLPDKLKSLRDFASYGQGGIQPLSADLVVASGFSSSKLLTVPALSSAGAIRYIQSREYAFSADGQQVYRIDTSDKGEDEVFLMVHRFPIAEVSERTMVQRRPYLLAQQTVTQAPLAPLDLGGTQAALPMFRHLWPDGRLLSIRGSSIHCMQVGEKSVSLHWHRQVHHDLDHWATQIRAEGDGVWITGLSVRQDAAVVARLGLDGSVQQWRFAAIEPPALDGGRVAIRTGPLTVERFRLEQPDVRESFTLNEVFLAQRGCVEPDTLRRGPVLPRSVPTLLRGQLLMMGHTLLYLPWHGEWVMNLRSTKPKDQIFSRKLPLEGQAVRHFGTQVVARLRSLLTEVGYTVALSSAAVDKKGACSLSFRLWGEQSGFSALCAAGAARECWLHYDRSSLGRHNPSLMLLPSPIEAPCSLAEVQAGLALLARHGFSAVDVMAPLMELLASRSVDTILAPEARGILAGAVLSAAVGEVFDGAPLASAAAAEARLAGGTVGHIPTTFDQSSRLYGVAEPGPTLVRELVARLLG